MKIKTSELVGNPLAWAVAVSDSNEPFFWANWEGEEFPETDDGPFRPDLDWSQGGPIIEREVLNGLQLGRKTTGAMKFCCYAEYQGHMWEQLRKHYGPTTLIAAMRAYVASKLGDEIEIPKELQDVR